MSLIPTPVYRTAAQSTRVAQTTYDAAILNMPGRITGATLLFRLTAVTTPVTLSVGLYQRKTPNGTFTLIEAVSFTPGAGGAQDVSVAMASLGYQPGELLVLWGRSSVGGTATMRTYGTQNYNGLNSNVQTGEYPVTGTTALAAGTPPTTVATTDITASTLDVGPVLRVA